jgi:CDP-L-myo-inositol myo-inositolphosphotransferase
MIAQRMYIVPIDGDDVRFLGGSARARNARVAERAGANIRPLASLPASGADTAVLVPPQAALMLALFRDQSFIDATHQASPVWLDAEPGASVLVGSAAEIADVARDTARLARLPRRAVARGTILNIATAADRRRATGLALRATEKATDGWVSRHVNRPISRAVSRAALVLGLSANTASLLTLLIGLGCAWTAAQPGYLPLVVTGLLFQLASILDGVDGEIARATLTESEAGARVDTLVDQVTYLACFAGATIGWVREGSGQLALGSTAFIGVALVLSLLRGGRFVARHSDNASFVFIDRSVRRAARDTGRLPLRMAAGTFTLLRRDVFAVIFFAVSLTGLRASIPALILAGILVANMTFSFYGQELADAARAERGLPEPANAEG